MDRQLANCMLARKLMIQCLRMLLFFQKRISIEALITMQIDRLTRLRCPSCHGKFLQPEDLEEEAGYTCEPCKDCMLEPKKKLREKALRTNSYICKYLCVYIVKNCN